MLREGSHSLAEELLADRTPPLKNYPVSFLRLTICLVGTRAMGLLIGFSLHSFSKPVLGEAWSPPNGEFINNGWYRYRRMLPQGCT